MIRHLSSDAAYTQGVGVRVGWRRACKSVVGNTGLEWFETAACVFGALGTIILLTPLRCSSIVPPASMVPLLLCAVLIRTHAEHGWSERSEGRAGVSATVKEPADAAITCDPYAHACPQTKAS